jgi:glycosyltransferase involved in cell wall biosynthesis
LAFTLGAWHGTRRTHAPPTDIQLAGADVVVLHSVADWFDVPAWLEAVAGRFKVVVVMHDLWHVSGGCFVRDTCSRFRETCRPCPLLKLPLAGILAANELKRKVRAYQQVGAHFVANSRWLRNVVMDSPVVQGREIAVIPPPVDSTCFFWQDRAACRERFGIPTDALVVATGCASLTDPNKNTSGLLQMIGELAIPGLILLVFGDGDIPSPLSLDVRWLGLQTDKDELATIYGAADVFASASGMETYGLTLAEAYACGCAVVAYEVGGIPEAVPAGPWTYLAPAEDRAAYVAKLWAAINFTRSVHQDLSREVRPVSVAANSETCAARFLELFQ